MSASRCASATPSSAVHHCTTLALAASNGFNAFFSYGRYVADSVLTLCVTVSAKIQTALLHIILLK